MLTFSPIIRIFVYANMRIVKKIVKKKIKNFVGAEK